MRRIAEFVECAGGISDFQQSILEAARRVLSEVELADLELIILADGYAGWEGRVISVIKARAQGQFEALMSGPNLHRSTSAARAPIRTVVGDKSSPNLRRFICARCQFEFNSVSPRGICCFGMPECPGCAHILHAPGCPTARPAPPAAQDNP